MSPDTNQTPWSRFFRLLYYVGVVLCVVVVATSIAILYVHGWHQHLLRFLSRAWQNFLMHIGSTEPGFISPIIVSVLSIIGTILCIRYLQGRDAMLKHWWENAAITALMTFAFLAVVYGPQVIWELAKTSYNDHQTLANEIGGLQAYASDKKKFDDKLRQALSEVERWHNAYSGLSRGDIHPDRVLNSEESNKLFEALRQSSKDPRNKDWVTVEMGSVQDREAMHLGSQLWGIFHEAHWTIKPRKKLGKEFENLYPLLLGVTILTDNQDQSRGTWLGWQLKDAGLADTYINPNPIPPTFKGTVVWIGYKQYP
jgi:hypothetical protein